MNAAQPELEQVEEARVLETLKSLLDRFQALSEKEVKMESGWPSCLRDSRMNSRVCKRRRNAGR